MVAFLMECGRSVGTNERLQIDICCFSANDDTLRNNSKAKRLGNQDTCNMSEWSDMSTRGELLFQWASTVEIQFNVLV